MLFVAGDSHGLALGQGTKCLDSSTRQILEDYFGSLKVGVVMIGYNAYDLFFQVSPDGLSMSGENGDRLTALTGDPRGIFASNERAFGFCFGLHLFGLHPALLGSSNRWASHSLMRCDDRQFVSDAVMKEIMLHHGRYVLQFARLLKHMNVASFFIGPPPVRAAMIEARTGSMAQAEIVQLQKLFWSVMGEALNEIGVPVVLAPAASMTDGVLRPELATDAPDDVHHANAEYGSLVWREIAGRIASGNFLGRPPFRADDMAPDTPSN